MNTSSMENLQCKSIVLVVNSSNFYTAPSLKRKSSSILKENKNESQTRM